MLDFSSHITDARSKSYIVARGIYILQSSILSFSTGRRHIATAGLENGHGLSVMVSWLNIRTKCCRACGTQERYMKTAEHEHLTGSTCPAPLG